VLKRRSGDDHIAAISAAVALLSELLGCPFGLGQIFSFRQRPLAADHPGRVEVKQMPSPVTGIEIGHRIVVQQRAQVERLAQQVSAELASLPVFDTRQGSRHRGLRRPAVPPCHRHQLRPDILCAVGKTMESLAFLLCTKERQRKQEDIDALISTLSLESESAFDLIEKTRTAGRQNQRRKLTMGWIQSICISLLNGGDNDL